MVKLPMFKYESLQHLKDDIRSDKGYTDMYCRIKDDPFFIESYNGHITSIKSYDGTLSRKFTHIPRRWAGTYFNRAIEIPREEYMMLREVSRIYNKEEL